MPLLCPRFDIRTRIMHEQKNIHVYLQFKLTNISVGMRLGLNPRQTCLFVPPPTTRPQVYVCTHKLHTLFLLIFYAEPFTCFDCSTKEHGEVCSDPFDFEEAYGADMPMVQCSTSCIKWVRRDLGEFMFMTGD